MTEQIGATESSLIDLIIKENIHRGFLKIGEVRWQIKDKWHFLEVPVV